MFHIPAHKSSTAGQFHFAPVVPAKVTKRLLKRKSSYIVYIALTVGAVYGAMYDAELVTCGTLQANGTFVDCDGQDVTEAFDTADYLVS